MTYYMSVVVMVKLASYLLQIGAFHDKLASDLLQVGSCHGKVGQ